MGWSDRRSSHRLSLPGRPDLFVHSGEFAPDEILPAVLSSGSPLQRFLPIVSSFVTAVFFLPLHHLMPDNCGTMAQHLILTVPLSGIRRKVLPAAEQWDTRVDNCAALMRRLAPFSFFFVLLYLRDKYSFFKSIDGQLIIDI